MKISYGQIWKTFYPVLFSLLIEYVISLTDTAYLGRVGEIELGASALAGNYYQTIFMLACGFGMGVQILIGRRNGENRLQEIGPIFRQGIFFMIFLAAVLFIVSLYGAPPLLRRVIQADAVYNATNQYIRWRIYGFFFSFISVMFRSFFIGITQTRILTVNSIIQVFANAMLNYILIFGKAGFPPLGIAGAAIASSISELIAMLFFLIYTALKVDRVRYGLFLRGKINFGILRHILNISGWTMLQSFLSAGIWLSFFVIVERLGERPLAVTNMIRCTSSLLFIVVSGSALAVSSLTSNLIGAGLSRCLRSLVIRSILMTYAFLLPIVLVMTLFPTQILHVYTNNAELIAASVPSLMVMLSSYLILVPGFLLFYAVFGTGNTRLTLMLKLSSLLVSGCYLLCLFPLLRKEIAWYWTSEHIYALMLLSLSFLFLKYGRWQHKHI